MRWGFATYDSLTEAGRRLLQLFEAEVDAGLRLADLVQRLRHLRGVLCILEKLNEGPKVAFKTYYGCGYHWRYAEMLKAMGVVEEYVVPSRGGTTTMARITPKGQRLLSALRELYSILEPQGAQGGEAPASKS